MKFFVTDSAETQDVDPHSTSGYQEFVDELMGGHWRLPPTQWVFMLCAALTVLICTKDGEDVSFKEFTGAQAPGMDVPWQNSQSASICLTRWCHRVCPEALTTALRSHHALQAEAAMMIDPLSTTSACDRIVWARPGEEAAIEGMADLNRIVQSNLEKLAAATEEDLKGLQKADLHKAQLAARAALRRFMNKRFRADDAFAHKAHCQLQATDVSSTPVAVMPVFDCCRRIPPWQVGQKGAAHKESGDAFLCMKRFSSSQGFMLSKYYQLRLNLLINPGQTYRAQ